MSVEDEVIDILESRADFLCSLPCDRLQSIYARAVKELKGVEIAREEEGVGISAGAALAGRKPVMLIQNSGLGNMINALASLTIFYSLPLAVIMSWRGLEKEKVEAQKPMGRYAPAILRAMEIPTFEVNRREDIPEIEEALRMAFEESRVVGVLINPEVWSDVKYEYNYPDVPLIDFQHKGEFKRKYTRFEFIRAIADYLRDKAVVSSLGYPSRELYHLAHKKSNFYMLGSMGMATPVALGVALSTKREVVCIDGDGSLLMNPSTLGTVARYSPENLVIIAVDNGVYASTGNQPSHAGTCADLACIARGFGIENVYTTDEPEELREILSQTEKPAFVRCIAKPGNAEVGLIPLSAQEIKRNFMESLK